LIEVALTGTFLQNPTTKLSSLNHEDYFYGSVESSLTTNDQRIQSCGRTEVQYLKERIKKMKQTVFALIFNLISLCTIGQDSLGLNDITAQLYFIGNIHFDNGIYYKVNEAYLREIAKNEENESTLYNYLIEEKGVNTILLEASVQDELFLNYLITQNLDSALIHVDTVKYPSAYAEVLRLRNLKKLHPSLTMMSIDVADQSSRHDFMTALVFSIFSQHKKLEPYFILPEEFGYETYNHIYEEYLAIYDSLRKVGYPADYLSLLKRSLDIKFFRSSKKRLVGPLVDDLKNFYSKNPEFQSPYISRLCHSYIKKAQVNSNQYAKNFCLIKLLKY